MEKFSIREIIEQAVQTERIGAKFYDEMARRFQENKDIKALFETLSAKEVQHEMTFSRLKEKVNEDIEGEDEFSEYLRAIVESAFFLGKDKSLTTMDEVRTVSDALAHALSFEKETLLYYVGLRDALEEKDLLDMIIKEEKSHIAWLSNFRAGLAK